MPTNTMAKTLDDKANENDCLSVYSPEERRVILDNPTFTPEDYPILAAVKRMSDEDLSTYDSIIASPKFNSSFYDKLHQEWIRQEGYFFMEKFTRDNPQLKFEKDPKKFMELFDSRFADEILNSQHSKRFRAFYSLKYPEQVLGHKHLEIPFDYRGRAA